MISQKEIKHNRLIEKADELFVSLGYKGVSMDQIAKEAGVSKMTMYKYFSSKEELFIKTILSLANRTFLYIKEQLEKIDGTLGKIDFLLNFSIEYSKKYSLAFYKDIMDNPYVLEKLMAEKIRMTKDVFEGIIINGKERGEIREVDEKFISGMLIALMKGVDNEYINTINSKEELDDFTEKFYDFLKYGLLGGRNE